jgi:hypothetical protein
MLMELAQHAFVGYSAEAAEKLAAQQLKGGTRGNGRTGKGASEGVADLQAPKLRNCVVNKLQDSADVGDTFKTGSMEFEFNCLEDLDMGTAGANKTKRASKPRAASAVGEMTGNYTIVKRTGLKASAETDSGKWEIWQHVWACNSFEEFFAKAPAKGTTKTGRIITARSEIKWAMLSGWIKPTVAAE